MEISNEIKELALRFVESEEMRECFRNTLLAGNNCTRLGSHPVGYCNDFIVGSRSGINDKLAALRKLPPNKETSGLIKAAEAALAELKASKDNVFLATLHYPYDTGKQETLEDRKPFLSFESVLKYVQEQTARQCEIYKESLEQCMERVWYEVEKFIPDEADELKHRITWTLNAKGEILFFELGDDFENLYYRSLHSDEDDEYTAWWDWKGGEWTYPPVPFDFGDIITIDMRPFYEDLRGVIVRIGDNHDCCAVACIYCDDDGYLYCRTLKHNLHRVLSKISPLYRAGRFKGVLPENEQALRLISEAIKKIPSFAKTCENGSIWRGHDLAQQFEDFLYSDDYNKRDGYFGCSWDEFRKRFGI